MVLSYVVIVQVLLDLMNTSFDIQERYVVVFLVGLHGANLLRTCVYHVFIGFVSGEKFTIVSAHNISAGDVYKPSIVIVLTPNSTHVRL